MKINELIDALKILENQYGNLDVLLLDTGNFTNPKPTKERIKYVAQSGLGKVYENEDVVIL